MFSYNLDKVDDLDVRPAPWRRSASGSDPEAVREVTLDRRQKYPSEGITEDIEDTVLSVSNDVARTRRGGSFAYEWFTTRSAHRGDITYFPHQRRDNVGFRVARTMPNR